MRILFLAHFYLPEVGAAVKRVSGLAKNLKKLGHDVEIITGFPNYPSGVKPEGYKRKLHMVEEIEGIKVHRYYVYASPKKNGITRLLNYVSFMLSSMFFVFNRKKYDVVITTSPPLFVGISGYVISRIKRMPLVFDIRDIWPDVAVEMGEIKENSLMYKVLNSIAKFVHKKAQLITVVTHKKRDKLVGKGLDPGKIEVVSNGFDREVLDFPSDPAVVVKYKLEEGFNLIYTGVVGLAQGLDIIIEAAEKLREYKDLRFIIIGDGVEKKELEKKVCNLNLNNVEFTGLQPHQKIFTFLRHAGAAIVPLKNQNLQDSVPTKMLEAMGAGCPPILCASGESADILNQSQGGIAVEPGNSEALKEAILELYHQPEKRREMGITGQKYILENYTRESIAKDLSNTLKNHFYKGEEKCKK